MSFPRTSMKYSLIENKIRKDRYNSLIFNESRGNELYLVGGYIRDVFRGDSAHDRDYIVRGNVLTLADNIREKIGGSIIVFEPKNTIRLALKNGPIFDFSEFHGTIGEDLSKRDFTINALAWSPVTGLIDLHGGITDIENKVVSSVRQKNIIDDPLRMMRAYRFAAEMSGTIDAKTRRIIKRFHKNICRVSTERITLEMFHLLNTDQPAKYLKMSLEDNLLNDIFLFNINYLNDNIEVMDNFRKEVLHLLPLKIKVMLHNIFSQNLSYGGLLFLHILLRDCPEEYMFSHLKASTRIMKRLRAISEGAKKLKGARIITSDILFRIFSTSGAASADILIVCNQLQYLRELMRYQRILKKGLLRAEEIMKIAGVEQGPQLGEIILALRKKHFEGRLKSRREAVLLIESLQNARNDISYLT